MDVWSHPNAQGTLFLKVRNSRIFGLSPFMAKQYQTHLGWSLFCPHSISPSRFMAGAYTKSPYHSIELIIQ